MVNREDIYEQEDDGVVVSKDQLWRLLVYSAVDPEAGTEERREGDVGKGELSQLENLNRDRRDAGYSR